MVTRGETFARMVFGAPRGRRAEGGECERGANERVNNCPVLPEYRVKSVNQISFFLLHPVSFANSDKAYPPRVNIRGM